MFIFCMVQIYPERSSLISVDNLAMKEAEYQHHGINSIWLIQLELYLLAWSSFGVFWYLYTIGDEDVMQMIKSVHSQQIVHQKKIMSIIQAFVFFPVDIYGH